MKLAQFVLVGMLLHSAVTIPVQNDNQTNIPIAFDNHQDPQLWQKSGKVEGDMVLTPEEQEHLYKGIANSNGVIDVRFRWPQRIIPYEFSDDFDAREKRFIAAVLKQDYARTCVRVVPRTNQSDYVYVTGKIDGCWSRLGRQGGKQELNLQRNGCLYYATIVHEFLHAAGFFHQQSATERDDYITINWENIETGREIQFVKYGANIISNFGQRYDYGSVMHYDAYAFSKNNQTTIVPKQNVQIGVAPRLSTVDIAKLNQMYGC